jgi:hypothetical protein
MTPSELQRFVDSSEGRDAGLSSSQARSQGIKSGRESARWLLKMMPTGTSFGRAVAEWTPAMWQWCRRQVSFISRMRGNKGKLYEADGRTKTRKHTSLLVWGHNPKKPLRQVPPC